MQQSAFDFRRGSGKGSTPRPVVLRRSQRCRAEGREQAAEQRATLHARMLGKYQQRDWTDQELADEMGIQRTTVIARRHELAGIVETGTRVNPQSGIRNTTYGLKKSRD